MPKAQTKLHPNPDVQMKLYTRFVTEVDELLEEYLGAIRVELRFAEHSTGMNMMRYDLAVVLVQELTATDLIAVANLLSKYTHCENERFDAPDGREYVLGDGDDHYAVMYRNGEFIVWLRGWPKGVMF